MRLVHKSHLAAVIAPLVVQVFVSLVGLVCPAIAHADFAGRLALYSDASLSQCSLTDTSPGIADIYVVHRIAGTPAALGVVGSIFAIAPSAGFNGTWLEDIVPAGLTRNGTSPTGIAVGYGGSCRFADLLVLHVRYQMQGTSPPCSSVEVVPHPAYPWMIITTTCGFGDELPVEGGRAIVNADQTCPCDHPVAAQPSTWGRIKAMYRD
jgi:hypothetical protein